MRIIKYTKIYLLISLLVLLPGVFSLFRYGLNLDIDFTGGSVFEYELADGSKDRVQVTSLLAEIFSQNQVEVKNVTFDGTKAIVKTKPVEVEKNEEIKTAVSQKFENANQVSFETVGPSIGLETTKKSFIALAIASIGILLYIAYAFRNVPKPYSSFKFGVTAIIAMLHDALVVLGIFSILGHFFHIEIDALFITAVLTVIGFSVHDTIVVFDRIRENLKKLPGSWGFSQIVDYSLIETLNRSVATSLTVVIVLLSLYLLGGGSIKHFTLALLIGIVSGTYSSIFNASPLLVIWEERRLRRKKR